MAVGICMGVVSAARRAWKRRNMRTTMWARMANCAARAESNDPKSSIPYTNRVANDMCSGANRRGMFSVYIPISSTSLKRSL